MPFVDVPTSSGPFSFRYSISTPASSSAERIASDLPCILFLHSGFVAQEIFELQFADRHLRQFNLIAIDMRGYGGTRGVIGDVRFTPAESAQDVQQIMRKLKLPPCHIFGISNGCSVALELAIITPGRVRSLTLCSPLSPTELEDVASGRLEIHRCWELASGSNIADDGQSTVVDEEFLEEAITGTSQILYNHTKTDIIQAMTALAVDVGKRNWMGSQEKLKQTYKSNVEWFNERRAIPKKLFKKINCPISIIHCHDDVAYSFEYAEDLEAALKEAGLSQASLHEAPGAHYGNLTDPQGINRILYETVVACHPDFPVNASLSSNDPHTKILTPFTRSLMQYGYDPADDDDDCDSNMFIDVAQSFKNTRACVRVRHFVSTPTLLPISSVSKHLVQGSR